MLKLELHVILLVTEYYSFGFFFSNRLMSEGTFLASCPYRNRQWAKTVCPTDCSLWTFDLTYRTRLKVKDLLQNEKAIAAPEERVIGAAPSITLTEFGMSSKPV